MFIIDCCSSRFSMSMKYNARYMSTDMQEKNIIEGMVTSMDNACLAHIKATSMKTNNTTGSTTDLIINSIAGRWQYFHA